METRALGSLQVSVVGVGCNNFGSRLDQASTTNVVLAALDAGSPSSTPRHLRRHPVRSDARRRPRRPA